ncbi:zinc finger and BTB domain-containing protein 8A.1-B-like [Tropilaelaps mercedesae]|uniref:Zinc finger and BTB domain-containing protein 8A.1-B-like n=1 Tax=Tropilaelaps mercedesae TaxID=418985 RepID=A0A1V9XGG4_9ACAR|nr:zinc finger and BTB domain-containing protein 8A.1-B-like [Tropilaelaps mercedesae]
MQTEVSATYSSGEPLNFTELCGLNNIYKANLNKGPATHAHKLVRQAQPAPYVSLRLFRFRGVVSGEDDFLRRLVSARFECPYCDYRCFRKYDLDRHVRKHTGEKPYGCNQCEMKYSRLEHLKSHIKAKHMCQISPLV